MLQVVDSIPWINSRSSLPGPTPTHRSSALGYDVVAETTNRIRHRKYDGSNRHQRRLDFRTIQTLNRVLDDAALFRGLDIARLGTFAKSLNLSGCSLLTDDAIHQVLNQCPDLESLNLSGTATTVSFTTRQQGVAAVRRYLAQLAVGSVTCTKLKAVIMGKGTAGKTSLVRALQALEAGGGQRPELPELDDRTIGVEMTLLFDTFAVHDFGGQPEYYPWHKLFLSREALYLLVADLSEGVDECVAALEEQLSILSASVPGAVVWWC